MLEGAPDVKATQARGLCDSLVSGAFLLVWRTTRKLAHGSTSRQRGATHGSESERL